MLNCLCIVTQQVDIIGILKIKIFYRKDEKKWGHRTVFPFPTETKKTGKLAITPNLI